MKTQALTDEVPIGRPFLVPTAASGATLTDHHLAGFDLRSVATMVTRFYGCAVAIVVAAAVVFWVFGSIVGVVGAFEEFMRGIGFTDFRSLSFQLLLGVTLLAAVVGALLVGMTVVTAALYNVLANRHGGIRIFVSGVSLVSANGAAAKNGNGRAASNGTAGNGTKHGVNGNGTSGVRRSTPRRAASSMRSYVQERRAAMRSHNGTFELE